jgi:hypothetical protein
MIIALFVRRILGVVPQRVVLLALLEALPQERSEKHEQTQARQAQAHTNGKGQFIE